MKKDDVDYLTMMMQIPPKQKIAITPFDLRTQREAFSVSLEGLKGVWLHFTHVYWLRADAVFSGTSTRLWQSLRKLVKTARSG